ncbi:unnamed protein product [Notodromas monacha]|uniref:Saccharopine dehydrogenase n=2 Tax=Notodromas monacha TaxID=399045 RepID=A0A7R9BZB8_9CRUS|nr:unnamed protein product [Notodromas monacha]CAG0923326.1 unnamed protein product [Notodromas monacha]
MLRIAPYTSVLVNGVYWSQEFPRLITLPDAKHLCEPVVAPWLAPCPGAPTLPHRLVAVCDISADLDGSIEFTVDCTTIDNPFWIYDPVHHTTHQNGLMAPGFLLCSIDNMPTQLPRESTHFFGELLLPHIYSILQSDAKKSMDDTHLSPEVTSAVITSNGKLTPGFQYIQTLRQNNAIQSRQKAGVPMAEARHKVLLLGAGFVSGPFVEYLTRDGEVKVTVASTVKEQADSLANKYPNTVPIHLNVQEASESLNAVVKEQDVVVSLLPYHLHPIVAKCCIQHQRNMVTSSYCSPAMQALHDRAVDAGITIVNEVGLDPGIDHLLAMEYIDNVHLKGGKIESFVSYCGGLPAPEHSENPLRYKFSWSPRGVLFNALSGAKYVLDGKIIEVPPGALMSSAEPVRFLPGFALEGYPNRDSLIYQEMYGISEAKTVLRGTLRYFGFAETMNALVKLGMIDSNSHPDFHAHGPDLSWRKFVCEQIGKSEDTLYENVKKELENVVGSAKIVDALEQLGLLSEDPVDKFDSPLDTLSNYLSNRLKLGPQDRDIVILRHDIGVRWPDGKLEKKGINLVCYGDVGEQGFTAMAKTVGYPSAIATKMVLNGEIQGKGNVLPFTPDIYRPMLTRLNQEGICPYES